ncbi:MAG: hypothetical protein ACXIUB_08955 [Wenzhouxiangella sp.]
MDQINRIFDQLDDWRHLPTYQLERRADIFFSLYLREILQTYISTEIQETIIPEFPLLQKTLDPSKNFDLHFSADYLAVSADLKRAFLIELKTDPNSSRTAQNQYLRQAKDVGLREMLEGLMNAFKPSMIQKSRIKRFYLLEKLRSIGLITGLDLAATFIAKDRQQGFTKAFQEARVASVQPEISLVCIHPEDKDPAERKHDDCTDKNTFDHWISFKDVIAVVEKHSDPLSQRFAQSLGAWRETAAGARVSK